MTQPTECVRCGFDMALCSVMTDPTVCESCWWEQELEGQPNDMD